MNAKFNSQIQTKSHSFFIEYKGLDYEVIIYTNNKRKFIDDSILFSGKELGYEGEEGKIRDEILGYLDENWDSLVK